MKSGRTAAARGFFVDTMSSKTVRSFAIQAVYFFAGILVSGGAVFGSYAPFGASMTAAVPFKKFYFHLLRACRWDIFCLHRAAASVMLPLYWPLAPYAGRSVT